MNMHDTRQLFLQRVRTAVADGNKAGAAGVLPTRGQVGYQGGGPNLVVRFCDELVAAGGQAHIVPRPETAQETIVTLMSGRPGCRVLLGGGKLLDDLQLATRLHGLGYEAIQKQSAAGRAIPADWFSADVGITGVDYLVAETGSLVLLARPDQPRSPSLLPPVHIAVAEASQIVPDLFDLFDLLGSKSKSSEADLPSCITLITGPSKTGDIELRLVTGVHGPGELHVVLIMQENR